MLKREVHDAAVNQSSFCLRSRPLLAGQSPEERPAPVPAPSYLFFILLYALIGLILGGGRADRGEARFWLWAGVCMALLLLLPLVPFQPLYQVSVFLVTSHVEILPALLLGICVSHLLPGRQRS